ncbi:ABC-type proline/glycine betaine transport system, permease component [Halalkaliarchaeum desulfuricum]|uniref:ABC-type proline/glycine betaine transport system, permease component n=1 Tax=Halalkaliarchaeum desulfuricum TaxID=2055893 RepID=A0A343TL66_9EURY|nr:ABC transporter permease [Halalkaliarchaeum desulfuricum]AUX09838.1 ABC-type proline/glycine betaine transport system, permease component [Halalkaliarchaeum desulfuricum]
MSENNVFIEGIIYLIENFDTFLGLLQEHLILVLVSELAAIAVAVPFGIIAVRYEWLRTYIRSAGNVAQTVPTLAVIALAFPIFGLGFNSAIIALFVYAILPILTNTIAGLEQVDESTIEAAKGMGMTRNEILRKIQIPLAIPVIFAGIRTSVVITVGTAYLAVFIGGGGLGVWVISGIDLFNTPQILAGAIPGALLAISLDTVFGLIERQLGSDVIQDQSLATG